MLGKKKKTKTIYEGEIKSLRVKGLYFTKKPKEMELETTVLKQHALFYKNAFNVLWSFDYDNKLANLEEAEYTMKHSNNPATLQIPYVDEEQVTQTSFEVTKKEFKQLKKNLKRKQSIK